MDRERVRDEWFGYPDGSQWLGKAEQKPDFALRVGNKRPETGVFSGNERTTGHRRHKLQEGTGMD